VKIRIGKRTWSVVFIVGSIFLVGGGNLVWTGYAVNNRTSEVKVAEQQAIATAVARSNHQWCDAINLLTVHPVSKPSNPAANPSRVEGYEFYQAFTVLHRKFRC
jgi:hypothetical protein